MRDSTGAEFLPDDVPSAQLPRLARISANEGDRRVLDLIGRAMRGDVAAFEQLVEPLLPRLYRLVTETTGPRTLRGPVACPAPASRTR